MKSLQRIQTLAKVGKILSKITFIGSVIGFGCTLLAALTLPFLKATHHFPFLFEYGYTLQSIYVVWLAWLPSCAGYAVLAKFAEHYFKHELQDGTPFTHCGAKLLLRLGILHIGIPIASSLLSEIVYAVASVAFQIFENVSLSTGSVALGITFIILSCLCSYGADIQKQLTQHES